MALGGRGVLMSRDPAGCCHATPASKTAISDFHYAEKNREKFPTPGPMSPLGYAQLSLPPWLLSLRPSRSGGRRRGVRGSNARGSGEEGGCHLDFRPLFCLAVYCEQQAIKLTCIAFGCEIRHSTSS